MSIGELGTICQTMQQFEQDMPTTLPRSSLSQVSTVSNRLVNTHVNEYRHSRTKLVRTDPFSDPFPARGVELT